MNLLNSFFQRNSNDLISIDSNYARCSRCSSLHQRKNGFSTHAAGLNITHPTLTIFHQCCNTGAARYNTTLQWRSQDCVAEGRLALMLGMYQKEGLGRKRATVERRRRQAVGGTNKLIGGASDSTVRRFNPAHHTRVTPCHAGRTTSN